MSCFSFCSAQGLAWNMVSHNCKFLFPLSLNRLGKVTVMHVAGPNVTKGTGYSFNVRIRTE